MFIQYGNYRHAGAEGSFVLSRDFSVGDSGFINGVTERWVITGRLEAPDRAQLTTELIALETAYSVNGLDLIFLDVDGVTPTAHNLISANSITGTRITNFSYADSRNAEYSTFRHYSITVEADFNLSPFGFPLAETFQDSLTFTSTGGPRFVVRTTLNGPPVRQQVAAFTPVQAVQTGSSTGRFSQPNPATPIYPIDEQVDRRQVTRTQSRSEGRTSFTTNWTYTYLAIQPFP